MVSEVMCCFNSLMILFLQISNSLLLQKCCSDEFFFMYLISLVEVNQALKWLSRMTLNLSTDDGSITIALKRKKPNW